jgi:hypothetical protein
LCHVDIQPLIITGTIERDGWAKKGGEKKYRSNDQ